VTTLARAEGLEAHARSVEVRVGQIGNLSARRQPRVDRETHA